MVTTSRLCCNSKAGTFFKKLSIASPNGNLCLGIYEQVRFFGWNEEDELENQMVKKLFDDIDSDGGGSLDKDETANLFKKLAITLSDTEYNQVSSARSGLPLDLFTVLLLEDGSLAQVSTLWHLLTALGVCVVRCLRSWTGRGTARSPTTSSSSGGSSRRTASPTWTSARALSSTRSAPSYAQRYAHHHRHDPP